MLHRCEKVEQFLFVVSVEKLQCQLFIIYLFFLIGFYNIVLLTFFIVILEDANPKVQIIICNINL